MTLVGTDESQVHDSVEIVCYNPNTAQSIAARLGENTTLEDITARLGTRGLGLRGIVTKRLLVYGSDAYEVAYVDELGDRNGKMGIIFPGEGKRIPNLLVRS
ncbi:MAG: hypothetical protein ABR884_03855 [Minisyncoccia bacterium]|jgi:hypothetical protein